MSLTPEERAFAGLLAPRPTSLRRERATVTAVDTAGQATVTFLAGSIPHVPMLGGGRPGPGQDVTMLAVDSDLLILGPDCDPWHQVTAFANAWTNYDNTVGSEYGTARYRREGDLLRLAGLIANGTAGLSTTNTAFTLPVGWRPAKTQIVSAQVAVAGATAGTGQLRVLTTGEVRPAVPNGTVLFCSLDGIVVPLT